MRFSMVVRQDAVDLAANSGRARDQLALEIGISKTALQRGRRTGAALFREIKVGGECGATEDQLLAFGGSLRLIHFRSASGATEASSRWQDSDPRGQANAADSGWGAAA